MVNQIKITLPQEEFSALVKLAIKELRDPPSQIRHIVRQELEAQGLLLAQAQPTQPETATNLGAQNVSNS